MFKIMTSLATLIAAAALVNLANATMTTVMPLRMIEHGASDAKVALFGALYFLGFAVGCFTQPIMIQRIGYIRAFAAAAGICTVLAVIMDQSETVKLWLVMRFFMGLSVAAIFAAVDGWINGVSPDAIRGKIFSAYGWCLGASAVTSQVLLIRFDGMTAGFITVMALAFNAALVLVSMSRSVAPTAEPATKEATGQRRLVITSVVSAATAAYAGLVVTAILAILPARLYESGFDEAAIGAVIGSFFLGRLLLQIPLGVIADRMDLRLLVAIIAALTGTTAVVGKILVLGSSTAATAYADYGTNFVLLGVMVVLGGLVLPLYTLANSLAFLKAEGRSPVRIATSLLLLNSFGAVAGPMLVAALTPSMGSAALPAVIGAASALTVAIALLGRKSVDGEPRIFGLSYIPTTSVASSGTMAKAKFEG